MHGLHGGFRTSHRSGSCLKHNPLQKCGNTPRYFTSRRITSHRVHSSNDSDSESGFIEKSTEFIDGLLEKQKKNLQKQEETNESLQLQLEAMRASDAPKFAVSVIEWLVKLNGSLRENEMVRLKELEADRDKFVAEWKEFEAKTENMDPIELDNLMDTVATGEDASFRATSVVVSAFVSAILFSWGSTFFGVDVANLLPDPSIPTASDLTTWAMWTLPYVGATAAAGAIFGIDWIGNRGTFRFLADDSFFAKLHPTAVFSLSSALAYSQAIAYQGVWLLFFLNLYRGDGGNNFSLDPSAADEAIVQQAMGSLVAAPKLIALVAGPAAVLSAAAVETSYFLAKELVNGVVQDVFQSDDGAAIIDPESGLIVLKEIKNSDEENEKYNVNGITNYEEKTIIGTITIGAPPTVPSLASLEMTPQEYWLTAGRVFLASMWMGAETLLTGNLWMAAATGAVGLAVGIGAKRSRGREAGLGDD